MWLVPCLSSLSLNVTVSERPYITTLRNRAHTLIFYCCTLTLFFMAPLKRFNYLFCPSYTRSFSVFITTGLALWEQAPWLYSAHDTQSTAHGSHSVNNYGHWRSLTRSNRHCMPYLYMSGAWTKQMEERRTLSSRIFGNIYSSVEDRALLPPTPPQIPQERLVFSCPK